MVGGGHPVSSLQIFSPGHVHTQLRKASCHSCEQASQWQTASRVTDPLKSSENLLVHIFGFIQGHNNILLLKLTQVWLNNQFINFFAAGSHFYTSHEKIVLAPQKEQQKTVHQQDLGEEEDSALPQPSPGHLYLLCASGMWGFPVLTHNSESHTDMRSKGSPGSRCFKYCELTGSVPSEFRQRVLFLWFLFLKWFSWIPKWPQTHCGAEDNLNLLILQPLPLSARITGASMPPKHI